VVETALKVLPERTKEGFQNLEMVTMSETTSPEANVGSWCLVAWRRSETGARRGERTYDVGRKSALHGCGIRESCPISPPSHPECSCHHETVLGSLRVLAYWQRWSDMHRAERQKTQPKSLQSEGNAISIMSFQSPKPSNSQRGAASWDPTQKRPFLTCW
jgi:hypothetical protein